MKHFILSCRDSRIAARHPFLVLAGLCLVPTLPLFYVFTAWTGQADFVFYSNLLNQFSQSFWHGHLYPRWLPNMNAGLGSPVMIFYAPLPYYFGVLLEPLRAVDPYAALRFSLLTLFAHVAAVLAFYMWMLRHVANPIALRAGILLALFPYLISVFYVQTGMSASWSFVFLVLTLIGVDRLLAGQRHGFLMVVFSFAGILLCHPPSFIVMSGLPLLYGVCVTRNAKRILMLAAAVTLGLGIDGFYWIPVYANLPYIHSEIFTEGKYAYAGNFGGLNELLCLPLLMIVPYALLRAKALPQHLRYFFGIATLAASFMTLSASRPLWDHIHLLAQLQFPFRFLIVLAVCVPPLAAVLWEVLPGRVVVIVLFVLVGVRYGLVASYLEPNRGIVEPYRTLQSAVFSYTRTGWSDVDPADTAQLSAVAHRDPVEILEGNVTSTTQADGAVLHVHSDSAKVSLRQFYFPGMQFLHGASPVNLSPGTHGFAEAILPRGDYVLSLWGTAPEEAITGFWISIGSLLLAIGLGYSISRRDQGAGMAVTEIS